MSKDVKRLFQQFKPEHYKLDLQPNREAMNFTGTVVIEGQKVGRPTQRLTFHQSGLTITKATIIKKDRKGDEELTITRINSQKSFDELRLHTEQMVYPGTYQVTLEFSGQITRAMDGIYPCYFEHDKAQKQLIATQFESHHAREVFPCIDEPEAKATFDLTLTSPANETVVANTPVAKQTKKGDVMVTTFETTPKMSSYLLAFVYGEMGYKEATTRDGVLVRTYATPDNVELTDFALDVAVKCLEYYNDYFGIPYPLEKCDLIALPDFASGAMENWGCITFREHCMFVDPKNTSLPSKQYVAMVVAHELAHQWFGNLVTMRWWTDLWLNEGFASWVEYLAMDFIFPEWQMWTQFITDVQQPALRLDALQHTHPVEVPVHHPDEIRSIFDLISYNKGASVIHMLHEYLGADMFRKGLQHYLKKHSYNNTDTSDLWDSLAEVSGKPVQDFMHSWTSQPGFPIVTAEFEQQEPLHHAQHVDLTASQQRFSFDHNTKPTELWPIPLKGRHALQDDTLEAKEQQYNIGAPDDKLWLNVKRSGYYRVVYNKEQQEKLKKFIEAGDLSPLDRLGLLADAFEAAKAGYSSTADALNLLASYKDEDNNAVWDVIAGGIGTIRAVMDDEGLREDLKPFIRKLVAKQLKRLGWEEKPGEPHFDTLLRPTMISMAALAEEPAIVAECLKRFEAMKKPEDVAPDIRSVIYGAAVRHGDKKTFEKLLGLYNSTSLSEERNTLAAALTGFKQPELIERALALITTDAVRLQDVVHWIVYVFSNRHARLAAWEWFTTNWQWLDDNLRSDMSFPRFPIYVARTFSDKKFIPLYKKFFEPRLTIGMERAYQQGLETVEWQSAWKERDLAEIKKFFKN